MTDLEIAKIDPSKVFKHPHDVVEDISLSRKDKIDILQQWEYDEREISVAEDENMQAHDNRHAIILDEVLKALMELGVDINENSAPTKQR